MPQSSIRIVLVGVALVVMASCVSTYAIGAGIAVTIPRLNPLIALLAPIILTVECYSQFIAMRSLAKRMLLAAGVFIFVLATILLGISCLAWTPVSTLGEVAIPSGRLVAYRVSVPLVSDFVLVKAELPIVPGIYVFKTKADLYPAWGANVRVEGNGLLVSYIDGNNRKQNVEVRP